MAENPPNQMKDINLTHPGNSTNSKQDKLKDIHNETHYCQTDKKTNRIMKAAGKKSLISKRDPP
jgi:hypothetical protein